MPEVSIYVALIAAGAALAPQILTWRQSVSQARMARQEKASTEIRLACENLYNATVDLETGIRKNKGYHGDEMTERMAKIWELSATADKSANTIAFLIPGDVAAAARKLADSGKAMARATEGEIDPRQGELRDLPNFTDLETSREDFRQRAVAYLKADASPASSVSGQQRAEAEVEAGHRPRWLGGRGQKR